ncbi:LOW QUALITY PROTEIN: uncharacterized protein LOC119098276 [Pollicipes pollicipes]|uniref:LOW QUALITY PROTEIN: uncharacterized protein LOC119098276 n=1 Tax=Pollicipes pollicipes TaxID=41117 RepID=UPI0018850E17|nr:LOW QUALITY PROTEIN: uncharacterized protein LOC119098276 [Pollicipes pollicipes]
MIQIRIRSHRSTGRPDWESTTSEPPPSPRLDEKDVTSAQIDTWIRQGDLEKLEQVLVDGHGDSLHGKTAWNEQARGILKAAPAFMEQIAAIHIAAARGDVAEVKELARIKGPHSKSAKLVQSLDEQGRLPLHLAAWYGHTPVIQFLTERYPAGVHILDKDSRAPQHYAAMASDSKKAKKNYNYLIEKGGNDNVKDLRGNTASYYLTNPADESRPPTPEKGAKLRERNRTQDRGRDQDHDRDRDRDRDQDGGRRSRGQSRHSPRRGSDRGEDADIDMDTVERMLLTGRGEELKGARSKDPDVQELLDSVPYILGKIESAHRAAESGETRDVQAQLDRRKLAGSTLKDGANPLHRAAFMGHAGVVRYLAQNFPDTMEAADRNGRTPLHYAAGSRDGGHCYKLLQRAGAREDATDKRGREPRYYLEHRGALRYTSVDQQTEDYADSEDEADAGAGASHRSPDRLGAGSRLDGRRASMDEHGSRSVSRASAAPDIEFTEDASRDEVDEIERAFETLQRSSSKSLLRKHLTRDVLEQVKRRRTRHGATLMDVIRSGVANLDSGVGVYAPDGDAYTVFAPLFDPIIEEYHAGFGPAMRQPSISFGHPKAAAKVLGNLSRLGKYVISTRIRTARSLEQFPLNPLMNEHDYLDLESEVSQVLKDLKGDLAGTYYPLDGMSAKDKKQLIDNHFLFKEGDRFLQAANASRHWPKGRGIFHNEAKTFLVWINEEDHLRVISMEQGGNVTSVYARLVTALVNLGKQLRLRRDRRLGSVTFCPTNLGTAIRASVHIRLPRLARNPAQLEAACARLGLQVRGTHGEHSESEEGVFDLSNKRRLGLTELDAVTEMYRGVSEIIQMERDAKK